MVEEIIQEKPTSSTAPVPSQEDKDAIAEIMSAGKRHLICNEPEQALELFVDVCERLANLYGQSADECAEAYLYYGKTLLELARLENGVLGHAVKETPAILGANGDTENEDAKTEDDETVDEKDDESLTETTTLKEKVDNAMRGGNLYNNASTEEDTDHEDETNDKVEEEKTGEQTASSGSSKGETIEDGPADNEEEEEMEEENDDEGGEQDVLNMELSWEMLELTCEICNRMIAEKGSNEKKAKEMLAEAKYGLAQISMEQEQYELAITDFKFCLDLQNVILTDKLDRRLAEVHYNIGLAYSFDKKFTEAITSFKQAVTMLESRKDMLKTKVEEATKNCGKEKASSELTDWKTEIEELDDLILLDMNAKIEDSIEMKRQADIATEKMKEAAKEMFGSISSAASGFDTGFETGFDAPSSTTESTEVINDISHKIRSAKRSSDDDLSSSESKKVKKQADTKETNGVANVADDQKPTSIGA